MDMMHVSSKVPRTVMQLVSMSVELTLYVSYTFSLERHQVSKLNVAMYGWLQHCQAKLCFVPLLSTRIENI